MARSMLSLLLALVLAACGSSFALAQTGDDPCASEPAAGASQVEDDEWLDDEEDWGDDALLDDEEEWPEDEELGGDEFDDDAFGDDEEFIDDCGDDLVDDEVFVDDEGDNADDPASSSRTRRGGKGADRFIGDAGVNRFFGEGGDDYLEGAGGRDVLNGGTGDDVIITGKRKAAASKKRVSKKGAKVKAGKGDDVVRARDGSVDRIHCGRGKDSVLADRGDRVRKNCETVRYG